VLTAIDDSADDLVAFLGEYVRFQSVNPDMKLDGELTELRACQEWLVGLLREWRAFTNVDLLAADVEQPNVVARCRGSATGPTALFIGHSDVVPVTAEQAAAWSAATPWAGTVKDGRLWGRGAADMKGGNAAFLWAIKTISDQGIELKGDVMVALVSGEESGNHRIGVDFVRAGGYEADFGIIAEPTNLEICPATVGEFYFLIRVQGRSAHLGSRHLAIHPSSFETEVSGVNAIDKMWKIQRALTELEREWGLWQKHPLMAPGAMNINLSAIHASGTFSALAGTCELVGSVLFNPSLTYAEVKREVLEAIESVAGTDYWLRDHPPEVIVPYILDQKEAVDLPRDHPGCRILEDAYRCTFEREPVVACSTATTDGAYVAAAGQKVLTCGPGTPDSGAHGVDEHIDIEQVIDAAKLYAAFAIKWCGQATGE